MSIDIEQAFVEEFQQLVQDGDRIAVELTPLQAFALVRTVQIALFVPEYEGVVREISVKLAQEVEKNIPAGPAMREMFRRSWEMDFGDE